MARSKAEIAEANRKREEAKLQRLLSQFEADPKAFAELIGKLSNKMLVPHSDGQREVLTAEQRFLVLCAGRRWGKSQIGAARALRHARNPKEIVWWVAPTYKVVKRGYEAVVKQIPDGLLVKPPPPDSVFDAGRSVRLEFKNGAKMEFYSAERPEGMLGGSCDFAILDEAATMPEHVWTQIIRPTLTDRQGSGLFISTPRGRNWFYYLWLRGQSDRPEDKEFKSWHFPSRTNPTIPSTEFDELANEMPQVLYEQEILAEFISEAASVFRFPLDEDGNNKAVSELHKPVGHIIMGIDLAKHSDYTVLFAIRATDRRPVYHDRFNNVSWTVQKSRIYEAIDELLDHEGSQATGITLLVDSGGPGDVIYDDLIDAGYDAIPINFTSYKEKMVNLLASDIENGRAFILPDQLSEFEHYAYSILASGRRRYEASRGHDDEVSATMLANWGMVHEGAPNVQTLTIGDYTASMDDHHEAAMTDTGIASQVTIDLRPPTPEELLQRTDIWN